MESIPQSPEMMSSKIKGRAEGGRRRRLLLALLQIERRIQRSLPREQFLQPRFGCAGQAPTGRVSLKAVPEEGAVIHNAAYLSRSAP